MISRQWKCILKEEEHDNYIRFLNEVVFKKAKSLSGFVSFQICKRPLKQNIEFMVITQWSDLKSIEAFSGKDINLAMVPEEAQQMMISYDSHVTHYEINVD